MLRGTMRALKLEAEAWSKGTESHSATLCVLGRLDICPSKKGRFFSTQGPGQSLGHHWVAERPEPKIWDQHLAEKLQMISKNPKGGVEQLYAAVKHLEEL